MSFDTAASGSTMSTGSSTIDWQRIAHWTDRIVAGDIADIAPAFLTQGLPPPVVRWQPTGDDLPVEPLRVLLRYWSTLVVDGALPHHRCVDPIDFRPALGFVIILESVDDGREFRYRLFGSSIARTSGFDMTGKLMSAHPASPHATEFAIASTLACARRGQPLYTERQPAWAEMTMRWPRLALPLTDDTSEVTRILVGSTPLDRDGRIVVA
ncbi:hypothetical protein BAL199_29912 [alpha proteobacterium BAL199]|nr:hypothetical protein BAL199_29912 [alpha proteobacterium BAL199]